MDVCLCVRMHGEPLNRLIVFLSSNIHFLFLPTLSFFEEDEKERKKVMKKRCVMCVEKGEMPRISLFFLLLKT